MKRWLQILGFGILTWLVPFVASFFFFRGTQLVIDLATFKIIMALLLCFVTILCLRFLFRRQAQTKATALVIGLVWLCLNLFLDTLILVPMSGSSFPRYFSTVGLVYFLIPMLSLAMATPREQPLLKQ